MKIYTKIIKRVLEEKLYPAFLCGYDFKIKSSPIGWTIKTYGFSEKQLYIFKTVLKVLKSCEISEIQFNTERAMLLQSLENSLICKSGRIALEKENSVLSTPFYHTKQKIDMLKSKSFDFLDVRTFIKRVFNKSEKGVQTLVFGNFERNLPEQLKDFVVLELGLERNALEIPLWGKKREIVLGKDDVLFEFDHQKDKNHSLRVVYQIGEDNIKNRCILRILQSITKLPFFDYIRTKSALAYSVSSSFYRKRGILHFCFTITSSKCDPKFLEKKVDDFIINFTDHLAKLSKESFDSVLSAIKTNLEQKPKNLYKASEEVWNEICLHRYDFASKKAEILCLERITNEEVQNFYYTVFRRRDIKGRLSVRVFANGYSKNPKSVVKHGKEVYTEINLGNLKRKMCLYKTPY